MIASSENKVYQNLLKKGDGSILRAIRIDKGAGRGLIAGGIVFLVFGLLFGIPLLIFAASPMAGLAVFGVSLVPAIIMIVPGIILKKKREAKWLSYYQKEYGYSEAELLQADRELALPSVKLVVCRRPGSLKEDYVYCFITENFVLINGVWPYLKRLEDYIAVAFSDSRDQWVMASLTKQDDSTMGIPLFTDTERKKALCMEVMQELQRHNPDILCGQQIVCEDRVYILERDGEQLMRLYKEGRKLESIN